jgi:hypothetical protein
VGGLTSATDSQTFRRELSLTDPGWVSCGVLTTVRAARAGGSAAAGEGHKPPLLTLLTGFGRSLELRVLDRLITRTKSHNVAVRSRAGVVT